MAKSNVQSVSYLLSTNCPKTTKSVLTYTHIMQNIHKHQTQNIRRKSPFGIAPVNQIFKKLFLVFFWREWAEAIKKKEYYINA